jgi:lysophospholipase L1-like esterase
MKNRVLCQVLAIGLMGIADAQIKVACIGNSITEGYGLQNASTQSYPSRLKAILGNGYTVQNDGASGRTMLKSDAKNSYWKYGKLSQALALKPDIVVIELGTNDANNFAGQWATMGPEFKKDYLAMVDTLRTLSPKPKIYPVMPLPIRGNNDATLVKANALIKEVAAERGLTVIDCYAPFKDKAQLYNDGLHPNAAGADTMAHIVFRAITATVSIAMERPSLRSNPASASSSRSLFLDVQGNNFPTLMRSLEQDGLYSIRVFDNRGALLASMDGNGASPELEAIHSRLKASHGISWVSVEQKRKAFR